MKVLFIIVFWFVTLPASAQIAQIKVSPEDQKEMREIGLEVNAIFRDQGNLVLEIIETTNQVAALDEYIRVLMPSRATRDMGVRLQLESELRFLQVAFELFNDRKLDIDVRQQRVTERAERLGTRYKILVPIIPIP